MVMTDPKAVVELPRWWSGLLLTGGAMIVEWTARKLIPHGVRVEHNAVVSAVFTVVGTTYDVLLAFVAMLALEDYNEAEAVTVHEVSLLEDVSQLSAVNGPGSVFASLLGAPKLAVQLVMTSLLALSGALVLLVVVSLSNTFEGDLAISNEPFQRALVEIKKLAEPLSGPCQDISVRTAATL